MADEEPTRQSRKKRLTVEERFFAKVEKSEDGCWLWQGCRVRVGYGQTFFNGRRIYAHRLSYLMAFGEVPNGLRVLHNCPSGDNPQCVRPDHLWLGTQRENMQDCATKGRIAKGDRSGTRTHPESRARGERSGKAKLTWERVRSMRMLYRTERPSERQLARIYNISRGAVRNVLSGVTWKEKNDEGNSYPR